MSDEKETRVKVVDAYDDHALHVRWDSLTRGVVAIRAQYAESTILNLAGITKLREALDKAEAAYHAAKPKPVTITEAPFTGTREEADALLGKGNGFAAMADDMGVFRPAAPIVALHTCGHRTLTDWVRSQPKGARLLAVFRDGENIPAVSAYDNHGKQIHECYEHALYARMAGGYGYSAVWLSREVARDCEKRIPHGVSVYREGQSLPAQDIGQRIRHLRRERKLTLEDTAFALNTSIPGASDIERGRKTPTEEQIAALAVLFSVGVETLRGGK